LKSAAGSVPFSGSGAPSSSTLAAGSYLSSPVPSLYVDLTAKTLYVCTTAGTNSTSAWTVISAPQTTLAQYKIVDATPADYLICHTWDGTTEGVSAINVAKSPELRNPGSEVIDSNTYSYSYTGAYTTLKRLSSVTIATVTTTEKQDIVPRFLAGSIIMAATVNGTTGVSVSGTPLTIQDINVAARNWCRAYTQ
jgi:hypothetical protein